MRSIIGRLTLSFLVFLSCVFGLIYVLTTGIQEQSLERTGALAGRLASQFVREEWEKQAKALVDMYAEQLVQPVYVMNLQTIRDLAAAPRKQRIVVSIHVLDDTGMILSDGTNESTRTGQMFSGAMRSNPDSLLVQSLIQVGSRVIGSVVAEFDLDMARLAGETLNARTRGIFGQAIAESAKTLGLLFLLAAAVGMSGAYLMARGLTRRIALAGDAIERLARQDFEVSFPGKARDEIGMLSQTIERVAQVLRDTTVSRGYLGRIIDNMPSGVAVTGMDGRILMANPFIMNLCGIPTAPNTGLAEVLHLDPGYVRDLLRELAATAEVLDREVSLCAEERRVEAHLLGVCLNPTAELSRRNVLFVVHDISERKIFERRLRHQATHDQLTGLYNRHGVVEVMDRELARFHEGSGHGFWLVFLDLDNFKRVNDTLGHAAGDVLLREVSDRLMHASRESDLVARLGGDEFLVMVRGDISEAKAIVIGQRFLASVRQPTGTGQTGPTISASAGLARCRREHLKAADILGEADMAMYEAKKQGRDRLVVLVGRDAAGPGEAHD